MTKRQKLLHTFRPIAPTAIDRIAIEIGFITIYWAWLEDAIDELIDELVPLDGGHIAQAITGNVDLRQKVQMVKALAFINKIKADDWYDSVIETLNTIDNNLRLRRNTLTHSAWYTPKGRLTRHKKGVKISKPQSFQPPQLQTIEKVPFKISDARALKKEILQALRRVVFQSAYAMGAVEYASQRISYAQFLRAVAPSAYQIRKQAKPTPRRRPSPA
jgi:hypothetical protein